MSPTLQVQQKVISRKLTSENKDKPAKYSVVAGNSLHSDYVKLKEGSGEKKTKENLA